MDPSERVTPRTVHVVVNRKKPIVFADCTIPIDKILARMRESLMGDGMVVVTEVNGAE